MDLRIDYLADHPALVPTVTRWVHDEWPHFNPGSTFEDALAGMQAKLTRHAIPEALVAFLGEQAVGTASLVKTDMVTPEGFSPWLASVYVPPEHRNRGIGSALVERMMQEVTSLGTDKLYLYTPDKVAFYERLGWTALRTTEHHGRDVTIMEYSIRK